MGNYQDASESKRNIATSYTEEGIQDFASSLLKASEIELILPKKMKQMSAQYNFPISFLLINISIDRVLEGLKETKPEMVPPMREAKKEAKKKD